ncbi:uncharacterized protein LOC123547343 [Mercenaria mercenaria]|uniref:uncharacterized protein LOC123547343 n=1 Tax=Mercenaria mercenaria TaxID=6596 RepID=UPI00234ED807|nr:uncharacterized protein LOC123547343 [Mercenaria mercenaria]
MRKKRGRQLPVTADFKIADSSEPDSAKTADSSEPDSTKIADSSEQDSVKLLQSSLADYAKNCESYGTENSNMNYSAVSQSTGKLLNRTEVVGPKTSDTKASEVARNEVPVSINAACSVTVDSATESVHTVKQKEKTNFGLVDILDLTEDNTVNMTIETSVGKTVEAKSLTSVPEGSTSVTVATTNISDLPVKAADMTVEAVDSALEIPNVKGTSSSEAFGTASLTGPVDVTAGTPGFETVPSEVVTKTSENVDENNSYTLLDSPYRAQLVDFDSKLPCTPDPQNPLMKNLLSPLRQKKAMLSVSPSYSVFCENSTGCIPSTVTTPDIQRSVIDRQLDQLCNTTEQTLPAANNYLLDNGGSKVPAKQGQPYLENRSGDVVSQKGTYNLNLKNSEANNPTQTYVVPDGSNFCSGSRIDRSVPLSNAQNETYSATKVDMDGLSHPSKCGTSTESCEEFVQMGGKQRNLSDSYYSTGYQTLVQPMNVATYTQCQNYITCPSVNQNTFFSPSVYSQEGANPIDANGNLSYVSSCQMPISTLNCVDSRLAMYKDSAMSSAYEPLDASHQSFRNMTDIGRDLAQTNENFSQYLGINMHKSTGCTTELSGITNGASFRTANGHYPSYITDKVVDSKNCMSVPATILDVPDMANGLQVFNCRNVEARNVLDNQKIESHKVLTNAYNRGNKVFDLTPRGTSEVINLVNNETNEVINLVNETNKVINLVDTETNEAINLADSERGEGINFVDSERSEVINLVDNEKCEGVKPATNQTSHMVGHVNKEMSNLYNYSLYETSAAINNASKEANEVLNNKHLEQVIGDGRIPNRLTILKQLGNVVQEGANVKTKTSLCDFLKRGGSKLRPDVSISQEERSPRISRPRSRRNNSSFEKPLLAPGPSVYTFTSPSDAHLMHQNMDLQPLEHFQKRDGTMFLVNKVLEKNCPSQVVEIKYCDCPISEGMDVPVEQVFIRDGQMYQLPDANIVRIGKFEFYAFLKDGLFCIPVGNFIRVVGREVRSLFASVIDLKSLNLHSLTPDEVCLLEQKCKNYFDSSNKDLIDLVSIQKICLDLLNLRPDNITLKMLAFSIPCQRQFGSHVRCSKCGLPKRGQGKDKRYVPLAKTGNHTAKVAATVGTLKIGEDEFTSFELSSGTYVSFKDIVQNKIMSLSVLQERMKKINSKAIKAPKGIEEYFFMHSCLVDNTLWIDTVTLRCLVCMSPFGRMASKHAGKIARGEYSYEPAYNLLCEDTSKLEKVFAINAKKLTVEEYNIEDRLCNTKLPFILAMTTKKRAESVNSKVDSTTGSVETNKETVKSVLEDNPEKHVQVEEAGSNADTTCPGTYEDLRKEQVDSLQGDDNSEENLNCRMNLRPRKKKESPVVKDFLMIFSSSADDDEHFESNSESDYSGSINKKQNKENKAKKQSGSDDKVVLKAGDYIISDYENFCKKLDAGLIVKRDNGDALVGLNSEDKQATAVLEESLEEEQHEKEELCAETVKSAELNLLNQAVQMSRISSSDLEQANKLNEVKHECQHFETMNSRSGYLVFDGNTKIEVNIEDNYMSARDNEVCLENPIRQVSNGLNNLEKMVNNDEISDRPFPDRDELNQTISDENTCLKLETACDLNAGEEVNGKHNNDTEMMTASRFKSSDRELLSCADLKIYNMEEEDESRICENTCMTKMIENHRSVDAPDVVLKTKEKVGECHESTKKGNREMPVAGVSTYSDTVMNIKQENTEDFCENNEATGEKSERSKGNDGERVNNDTIEFQIEHQELTKNCRPEKSPEKARIRSPKDGTFGKKNKVHIEVKLQIEVSPNGRRTDVCEGLSSKTGMSKDGRKTKEQERVTPETEMSPDRRKNKIQETVTPETEMSPDRRKNKNLETVTPEKEMSPDGAKDKIYTAVTSETETETEITQCSRKSRECKGVEPQIGMSPSGRKSITDEEKQKEMETNIKRYLVFMYVKEGPNPGFRVKKFQKGAEQIFPDLFLPDPENPETKRRRIKFMIAASKYMDDMFRQHRLQKQQQLLEKRKQEETNLVKSATSGVNMVDSASEAERKTDSRGKQESVLVDGDTEKEGYIESSCGTSIASITEKENSVDKIKEAMNVDKECGSNVSCNSNIEKVVAVGNKHEDKVKETLENSSGCFSDTVSKQKYRNGSESVSNSGRTSSDYCDRQRKGEKQKNIAQDIACSSKKSKLETVDRAKSELRENKKERCFSVKTRSDKGKESADISGPAAKKTDNEKCSKTTSKRKDEDELGNQIAALDKVAHVKVDSVLQKKHSTETKLDRNGIHCQTNYKGTLSGTQVVVNSNSCHCDTKQKKNRKLKSNNVNEQRRKTRSNSVDEPIEKELLQSHLTGSSRIDKYSYRKKKKRANDTRDSLNTTIKRNWENSMMAEGKKFKLSECYVQLKRIKLLDDAVLLS